MPHRLQRSEELPKSCASSANLFAFICGPPWAWIDWSAVFAELDIEYGLTSVGRKYGCHLGSRPHGRDRLPRLHELADVYRNALHPGDQDMIPATGIQDQELSVAAERSGINNPTVTRRCDLRPGPGRQRNAFFYATGAVGTAKIANLCTVNRKSKKSLGRCEGDRRAAAVRIFQRSQIRLAIGGRRRALGIGARGGVRGASDVLLHFGDQTLEIIDLLGQRNGARALGLDVLFHGRLLALSLVDQRTQSRLIIPELVAICGKAIAFARNGFAQR